MQLWRPEFEVDEIVRQLVPLLTNRDISLIMRGRLVCEVVCCMKVSSGP